MSGIRIQHATARNARYTVAESDRPYPAPYTCTPPEFGGCGGTHLFKTHHLNVDETGAAIVDRVLYERIRELLVLAGFRETNEVARPPTSTIGMAPARAGAGAWGNVPIIRSSDN